MRGRKIHCVKGILIWNRILKDAGADLSVSDKNEWTPMHHAAEKGHAEAIKGLKDAGADVSVIDNTGRTPMHYAVQKGHAKAIKALKDARS